MIAAGLALAAGALIGSYDLMSALHRFRAGPQAQVSASVVNPLRPGPGRSRA